MTCVPGAPGAPGRNGAKGDLGSPGKTGTQGPRGADGKKGAKGEPGIQGSAGQKGQRGDKGDNGTVSHMNWKECTWTSRHETDSGQIYVSEQLRLVFSFLLEEKIILVLTWTKDINKWGGLNRYHWSYAVAFPKINSILMWNRFSASSSSFFFSYFNTELWLREKEHKLCTPRLLCWHPQDIWLYRLL